MKIEITFDEEDNDFAFIEIDGKKLKIDRGEFGWQIDGCKDDTVGYFVAHKLFEAVRDIIKMRSLQMRYETWEVLDDEATLELLEEI